MTPEFQAPTPPGPWIEHAACVGVDPNIFFPEQGVQDNSKARAICASCPVKRQCGDYAVDEYIVHGIWGGMSEKERRPIRRQRRRNAA